MSTPYDLNLVDHLYKYVAAYKIGSGDLAWKEMIEKVASKKTSIYCKWSFYNERSGSSCENIEKKQSKILLDAVQYKLHRINRKF